MLSDLIARAFRRHPTGAPMGTCRADLHAAPLVVLPERKRQSDRLVELRRMLHPGAKILEFGPLANPIAAKREGYNAFTIDRMSQQELLDYYRIHPDINHSRIEPVDFVWKSGCILGAISQDHHGTFDCIVLSHVLEHVPDPLTLLNGFEVLLKPGGVVSMALPDCRFSFDVFRPLSTTGEMLEAKSNLAQSHSRKNLFDFSSRSVARLGRIVWEDGNLAPEMLTFVGMNLETAHATHFGRSIDSEDQDCHSWIFVPASFTLIAHECHAVGAIRLVLERVAPGSGSEFFAHFRLAERRSINHHERLHLLTLIADEQMQSLRKVRRIRLD